MQTLMPASRRALRRRLAAAGEAGYAAGVPLGRWYPELADCFLVAVTEARTRAEIDGLAAVLATREPDAAGASG